MSTQGYSLGNDQRAQLMMLVGALGQRRVAQLLRVSRPALDRVLKNRSVREGTLLLIAVGLPRAVEELS